MLTLSEDEQRLAGLLAMSPSGRWRTAGCLPPPEPDARGSLLFRLEFGGEDFRFYDITPRYFFHEESMSLRIRLGEGGALAVRAGARLIAGLSRQGELTDLWLEQLRFRA